MAGPLAAIIARQALSKFGDQLPAGVKETIGFMDNPKSAVTGMIKRAAEDRMKEELRKLEGSGLEEGKFGYGRPESDFASFRGEGLEGGGGGGKPRFDEAGMSVEAFKRGGKVKAKPARRIDGIAQRGKTRGRYL
jgi:hypothetical protein